MSVATLVAQHLSLAEAPDYRYFDLRGSHAHLGYELGRHDPPFKMQPWWSPPPPPGFANVCADVVCDLHPHLMDEHRAYADVQRLDAKMVWQRCCRVNLKARVSGSSAMHLNDTAEGCSTFAWYVDGRAVVGRNYDYFPQQVRRQRIRFEPDCCANATIGARGSVPGGRYDGINQHGLFVSLHVVMTDTPTMDEVKPGVPFHLVGRIALEMCHTAREAADLIARMPHLSSLNYLVADPREAFVVEADPRRVRVLPMEGSVIAATNHFRHPDMRPLQSNRTLTNSECRLSFLLSSGAEEPLRRGGRDSSLAVDDLLDHAERVMADRSAPVCGSSGSLTTLWSCVADLTTRRIRYAAGAPCLTPYEEMPMV